MTGIISEGSKRLVIVSGRAHPELAHAVAKELGTEVLSSSAYDFANGETYVRFNESVRGCDVFCIQSHGDRVNDWVMEQLIMVDALKRASAKRISVVAPFFPYARQDKKHLGREPISARLIADLYATAGAERLMSVDLHSAQEQGFFDGPGTTCGPSRCWLTTSLSTLTRLTPRWFLLTLAVFAWPSVGRTSLVAPRWHSFTRPVT